MSAKSSKKPKAIKLPPRTLPEITASYQELCTRAGQTQYQLFVLNKELESFNGQLLRLNQEGAKRNQLDQQAAKQEEPKPTEGATNEQS